MRATNAKSGSGGTPAGITLVQSIVSITDAQILAFPTSLPVRVAPDAGAGKVNIPIACAVYLTRLAGFGYLNLQAGASWGLVYDGATTCDLIGPTSMVLRQTGALVFGAGAVLNPTAIRGGSGDTLVNGMAANLRSGIEGKGLFFALNNAAGGNLTSGGAANSAKIVTLYYVGDIA